MNRIYKYELLRGSKHFICPACHHKTFKPYVLSEDGKTWAGSEFGRCERINSCGYLKYPNMKEMKFCEKDFNNSDCYFRDETKLIPDYIDKSIVESTFCNFRENVLARYIIKNFGSETFFDLQAKYNIGTAKNGGTIFWQEDIEGRFRTGKVFYYKPDGHRDKERASWFVHKKIKENFNLKQCLFGEHLLKDINVNKHEKKIFFNSNDISELESYFENIPLPTEPIKLNECTTIIDCSLFVKSHLNTVKAYIGKEIALPYLKRLNEFKQLLEVTKVALCESEKTAVLMSVLEPDFIWLASGGSEMLNAERLKVLTNQNILLTVFPDNGQFDKWKEKTRFITNRKMDYSVENAYNEGIIDKGADILDLYLLKTDLSIFKKKK